MLFTTLLFVSALLSVSAQTNKPAGRGCEANMQIFQAGEELTYEVSYFGIKLGSISTKVTSVRSTPQGKRISAESLIRSYRGVPFVTLNTLFQTRIDETLGSVAFRTKEYITDMSAFKYIEYVYNRANDVVYISEFVENREGTEKHDTLTLEGKRWQDGLSLLFYARAFAHAQCSKRVPVLVYRSKAMTSINFGVEEGRTSISALRHDVRTVKLSGETGFTGIFGLTGGFEGWFTDDAASIPVSAKMHVLIGSVRIELIEWKRRGWTPPRADS
jgi:hypothetical protein